jgi:hypothetical protein
LHILLFLLHLLTLIPPYWEIEVCLAEGTYPKLLIRICPDPIPSFEVIAAYLEPKQGGADQVFSVEGNCFCSRLLLVFGCFLDLGQPVFCPEFAGGPCICGDVVCLEGVAGLFW